MTICTADGFSLALVVVQAEHRAERWVLGDGVVEDRARVVDTAVVYEEE
ncbi:MAG: hypothetical protein P8J50_06265 [Acidimicrobiales bacterium]|nr:hypothetical protein [Acidimicrobiales bacterium]